VEVWFAKKSEFLAHTSLCHFLVAAAFFYAHFTSSLTFLHLFLERYGILAAHFSLLAHEGWKLPLQSGTSDFNRPKSSGRKSSADQSALFISAKTFFASH
jgi:hypothetical protein